MKFSKTSQLFLVSALGLVVATALTACQIVTIDYVFVASQGTPGADSNGMIETFAADSESGALRDVSKQISSGGVNPVSMAVTSDYANLYVANAGDEGGGTVAHFTIAVDGTLTAKDALSLSDSPVAVAVNATGTYLYVVSGTTSATLTAYSLSSGTIGSAVATMPLTIPGNESDSVVPTNVAVLANGTDVYATAYDQSAYNPGGTTTSNAHPGWIWSFQVGSGGALTAANGSPFQAGVKPVALATDPTSRFVYVADYASNQLVGYSVQSEGELNFLINGPFKTGNEPQAVAIDPRGIYMYVADALDSAVSSYTIDRATGTPALAVNTTGSSNASSDTEPVAIAVDPALGRFVYTANILGNSVSGFRLNPDTGAITQTQATPYPTGSSGTGAGGQRPSALVIVPHGNHAVQVTAP
ncbi:MAG TPA: beta-propeller fold lactonase family protein [Terracidiphilus sp.]|nr:beta-propeller fold lactonase family protein [Terracidiphilus sp.]